MQFCGISLLSLFDLSLCGWICVLSISVFGVYVLVDFVCFEFVYLVFMSMKFFVWSFDFWRLYIWSFCLSFGIWNLDDLSCVWSLCVLSFRFWRSGVYLWFVVCKFFVLSNENLSDTKMSPSCKWKVKKSWFARIFHSFTICKAEYLYEDRLQVRSCDTPMNKLDDVGIQFSLELFSPVPDAAQLVRWTCISWLIKLSHIFINKQSCKIWRINSVTL